MNVAPSDALLEARELHAYYGASHILHGVDFRIGRGETVALMGRNGMGKTTLIRTMLGIVKPRGGEVRVNVYSEAVDVGDGARSDARRKRAVTVRRQLVDIGADDGGARRS